MEKITFMSGEMQEETEFFVLEQTKVGGVSYILVTDSEEDEAECFILKGYRIRRSIGEPLRDGGGRRRTERGLQSI